MNNRLKQISQTDDDDTRKKYIETRVEILMFHKPYWDLMNSIDDSPIKNSIFNKN